MKIKTVEIQNWRSIKNVKIDFQDIMVFIGQNNHGKSNILSAILFFFGQLNCDDLDFNEGNDNLYVEITFHELDETDTTTFRKYVTSDRALKVRKQASKMGSFEYHGYLEVPSLEWLKEENISNYLKREIAETLPINDLLPDSGRITRDIFRKAQEDYIEANKNSINFNYQMETTNFLGAKNVAKGIFGEVYYVPSVKSVSDELNLRGNSVFSRLYSDVMKKMSEKNPEYIEAKEKIASLVKMLNKTTEEGLENPERPQEITDLEKNLEEELNSWDTKIEIEISPPNVDDIFRVGASIWVDDGVRTDINRKGHGLQRALIFALIKALAKTLKQEREKENMGNEIQNIATRQTSDSVFFIIEEPELYLHPQAQRELFSSLLDLSKSRTQVLLCTHSSSFINLELYRSICVVKKNNLSEGTKVFQCKEELFREEKKNFNLLYWINPERSELFFAKKVILVEGITEKIVIPFLAKKIDVFRFDCTMINCASKGSIPTYLNLLNKFSIPYVAVYDKDRQSHKTDNKKNGADRLSQKIEDLIDCSLGYSIILKNNIEEEIGILEKGNKSKPYIALNKVSDENFILTDSFKRKIENIYQ